MKKIAIIGIGKLGLCFALNLERKGYKVIGVDLSQDYVDSINNKTLKSDEQGVEEMLANSTKLEATTLISRALEADTIFVLVSTPSLPDGSYDHTQVDQVAKRLIALGKSDIRRDLIVGCTTMPGYCDELQERVKDFGYEVTYNPEFIAQGTIIKDQLYPDMVLIGTGNEETSKKLIGIYMNFVESFPKFSVMERKEAEITKIALNCFLTTKIAYANMVGDIARASNVNPDVILEAVGSDSRVGPKYLKYGYGFGGPCFPRDNRAFGLYADTVGVDALISKATDKSNAGHLEFQAKNYVRDTATFTHVTYKPESTLLTESQQLALAVRLADMGKTVRIIERKQIIEQLKEKYGDKFIYEQRASD